MKKTTLFLAAVILTGCAGQQKLDTLTAQMVKLNEQTEALARENAALRQSLLAQQRPQVASQPVAAPASQPVRPAAVQPPPRRVRPLRPARDQGFLYTENPYCPAGPYTLTIVNRSNYYIRIMVNGRAKSNIGGYGPLPHLPPGQTLTVCLDNLGENNISGIVYANRRGFLEKVKTFSRQLRAKLRQRGQRLVIDDHRIAWW